MIRHLAAATALALVVTPAVAQAPANEALAASVTAFVTDFASGLPDFIATAGVACFYGVAAALPAEDQAVILTGADFIDGINQLVKAKPEIAADFFTTLDGCGGTITAAGVMWDWVTRERTDLSPEAQAELGACLIGPIDRLVLDAKRGITRYQFGHFVNAIQSMVFERADLAGNFVAEVEACGVVVPPDPPPVPNPFN